MVRQRKDGLDHKNLISNAIKYTPAHGEVHIITRHDKDNWSLEITDTGIGIPAKEQKSYLSYTSGAAMPSMQNYRQWNRTDVSVETGTYS